mgnify:CR=1 FL=1
MMERLLMARNRVSRVRARSALAMLREDWESSAWVELTVHLGLPQKLQEAVGPLVESHPTQGLAESPAMRVAAVPLEARVASEPPAEVDSGN